MLTRREALRRLVLLGLSASGAAALLPACGGDDAPIRWRRPPRRAAVRGRDRRSRSKPTSYGSLTRAVIDAGEARLSAVVPFYGPAPEDADFRRAKAAVLGIYGELDNRVNATRERPEAARQAYQALLDWLDRHLRR